MALLVCALELVLLELEHIEAVVSATVGKQLEVVALLDDLAVGEDDDLVCVLNGGQTVRDDKHRADGLDLLEGVLDEKLGLGIDVCGSLVENDDGGLVHNRSREGEELTLACGEVVTSLSYLLIKSVCEFVDKVVGVDVAAGL